MSERDDLVEQAHSYTPPLTEAYVWVCPTCDGGGCGDCVER